MKKISDRGWFGESSLRSTSFAVIACVFFSIQAGLSRLFSYISSICGAEED